ncbi:MAG TPA: four helix bundle protein [Chloroflexi bacterium]|nr:four helix bundle protein [Chloroflexota bacterium]
MSYKSFEEMPLWQEAHALAVKIHKITSSFPKHELYGLTSQLRRAAVSIAANVAEAFGRYHYRDKLRFYYNSRGSAYEVKSHLLYARDVDYIAPDLFDDLVQPLDGIVHDLNKVIATIRGRLGVED